ncbi:manganese peroxidase 2, partial [Fusarium napiforme]
MKFTVLIAAALAAAPIPEAAAHPGMGETIKEIERIAARSWGSGWGGSKWPGQGNGGGSSSWPGQSNGNGGGSSSWPGQTNSGGSSSWPGQS